MTKTEIKLEKVQKEISTLEATLTGDVEKDKDIFDKLYPLYRESNLLSAKYLSEIL